MEEHEYQEAFQLLGKLMLKFEEKDSERAQPYLAALNKLYFYTNELRLKDIENTMLIDKYREK
tara:strand:+ start:162 stop:350 length:189 start_codon:yes stop_codon:yes gene_type:complete